MNKNKLLAIAILSISMITVMASAAVSPALANISRAFPDADVNLIKTVLTIPSLFILPFSLISGQLVHKFGNKRILMLGILVYIAGGIAPVFVDSISSLLFFRAVLGCGCGLIMPISQSLIALNYTGNTKAKLTGYSGAASYLMGVIASFIVAPVSSVNWHYSFYIYLIAVLVLILNIIYLPMDKPRPSAKKISTKKLSGKVWWLILAVMFVNIAFYAVPANVALFMKEQHIGTAQSAGTVISAFMIAGFIAGMVLSYIRQWMKKHTIIFGVNLMGIGYISLSFAHNLLFVIIGSAFVGFSFGILFPAFILLITNKCSAKRCVWALSMASCSQFLGQFLSPYVLQAVKNIFGLTSLRDDFVILAIFLSSVSIIYFVLNLRSGYKLSYRST